MSFLKAQVSFPSNIVSVFSAIKHNSPISFLPQTLYTLFKRSPLKCKFFRFSSARAKLPQIPYVNFELTSQFLFRFSIILHCHDTKLPCQFQAHTFSTLDQSIPSKSQFFDFPVFWWKFTKFLMSFLKLHVSFRSSVASIFSAIKHNSSILYLAQTLYTLVKGSPLKCKFLRFLSARVKIHQSPHLNFEMTSQFLFQFCIFFIVMTNSSPENFKLIHFLLWI